MFKGVKKIYLFFNKGDTIYIHRRAGYGKDPINCIEVYDCYTNKSVYKRGTVTLIEKSYNSLKKKN